MEFMTERFNLFGHATRNGFEQAYPGEPAFGM
jgi:hypothetical protein